MHLRRRLAPLAVLLAALPSVAAGQDEPTGQLTATSYGPMPENAVIRVEYETESALNIQLLEFIKQEIDIRSYHVSDQGPWTLRFSTDVIGEGAGPLRPQPKVEDTGSNPPKRYSGLVYVPLDSAGPSRRSKRYRLDFRVTTQTGERVWEGSLVADLLGTDRQTAFRAMVPILLNSLGETADQG